MKYGEQTGVWELIKIRNFSICQTVLNLPLPRFLADRKCRMQKVSLKVFWWRFNTRRYEEWRPSIYSKNLRLADCDNYGSLICLILPILPSLCEDANTQAVNAHLVDQLESWWRHHEVIRWRHGITDHVAGFPTITDKPNTITPLHVLSKIA